ncbi:hypothetical protein IAT40_004178 [Kwoniella sp. CBS 6097]
MNLGTALSTSGSSSQPAAQTKKRRTNVGKACEPCRRRYGIKADMATLLRTGVVSEISNFGYDRETQALLDHILRPHLDVLGSQSYGNGPSM